MLVRAPSGRQRLNVLGAVHAITHQLITVTNDSYINAASVCELLEKIALLGLQTPITVVMDNARYQRCRLMLERAAHLGIEVLFLPTYCFLKCSKTYLQHLRTCFIAGSFTLDASRASASRSTGEFLSRRSHNRDIRYQTEGFVPDVQGRIQISLVNYLTLLTYPLSDIEREVFLDPSTTMTGLA